MVFGGYVVNFGARLGFPGYVVRGVGWGGGVFRDPGPVRPLSGKFWHIKPYGIALCWDDTVTEIFSREVVYGGDVSSNYQFHIVSIDAV